MDRFELAAFLRFARAFALASALRCCDGANVPVSPRVDRLVGLALALALALGLALALPLPLPLPLPLAAAAAAAACLARSASRYLERGGVSA